MQFFEQFPDDAPEAVLQWPSMMKPEEIALLYRLARHYYAGEGVIVDAGVFLGASTNAFATGLRSNPAALTAIGAPTRKPIHCYDIAMFVPSMTKHVLQPAFKKILNDTLPVPGDSFEPLLRKLLAEQDDLIDFRIGDIVTRVHADAPVEIAFYDCLKTKVRDWAAFRALGPHYIPGRTIIVQQDYFYEYAPDNKIRQEYLAPYFEFLGASMTSGFFRLIKPIPETYFIVDPVDALSPAEKIALLEQAAVRTSSVRHALATRLSIPVFLLERGDTHAARAHLDAFDRDNRDSESFARLQKSMQKLRKKITHIEEHST